MQELSEDGFVWHESVTNGYLIILFCVWLGDFASQPVWISSVLKYDIFFFFGLNLFLFPAEIYTFYCFIQEEP